MTDLAAQGPGAPLPDDGIDGYRILRSIGEGGMGEVYEAEQFEPVRRRVAVKVIKHGLDSKEVIARFETERQALALMDHPYIARVFDAGTTRRGRPFFAMEFVGGPPITEHCDQQRLDTEARIRLFVQVCEGVQHAHHKAVIHRDLKSSNVLVTMADGSAVPKIIDFGVAKATSRPLTERTLFTELGQMIGTPEYMSPEQADLTGEHVDTRTDVYSLGVLLYELLVGALPFDPRQLRRAGFESLLRTIREVEPPRPSTRVSGLSGESAATAHNRRCSTRGLVSLLRGDLDWITLRALAKDRTRRYGSPAELAADLLRHLRHEPVVARPPSAVYRLTRFGRRHRVGVAVGLAALIAAAVFVFQTVRQNRVIAAERDRAQQAAAQATSVNDFLQRMLGAADPEIALGRPLTVREIVDLADQELRHDEPEPAVAMALHQTLGRTYQSLGALEPASRHLEDALRLASAGAGFGAESPIRLAWSRLDLANLRHSQGQHAEARELASQALAAFQAAHGPEHPQVASCRSLLARILYAEGDWRAAASEHEAVLAMRRRLFGDDSAQVAHSLRQLAFVLEQTGDDAAALPLALEALRIQERQRGELHPEIVQCLIEVAAIESDLGNIDAAERDLRAALGKAQQLYGELHPGVANCEWRLGTLLQLRNRAQEAMPLLESALQKRRELLRAPHNDIATAAASLGEVCIDRGELDRAETLYAEALAMRRQIFGDDHPSVASSLADLGVLRRHQQRQPEAEVILRQAIVAWRRCRGPDSLDEATATNLLALVLQDQKKHDEAETCFRESLRIEQVLHPAGHPRVARAINNLASLLFRKGDAAGSETMFRAALELRRQLLDRGHPELLETIANLAYVLQARAAFDEAGHLLREHLDATRDTLPAGHATVLRAQRMLAANLVAQARWRDAEALLLDVRQQQNDANSTPTSRRATVEQLVRVYEGLLDDDRAQHWRGVLEALPAGR